MQLCVLSSRDCLIPSGPVRNHHHCRQNPTLHCHQQHKLLPHLPPWMPWVTRAALLQEVNVPAEAVHFVRVVNPWSAIIVCLEPSLDLPLCVSSNPALASRPVVWVAIHNLQTEPIMLHAGHDGVDIIELGEGISCATPSLSELVPKHLRPLQQQQLTCLLEQ